MPKDKKMWDNILTVIMSLLCLLWIYPIVLILQIITLVPYGITFGSVAIVFPSATGVPDAVTLDALSQQISQGQ